MIVINRLACSPEFTAVLDALDAGHAVRRSAWPAGQLLRKLGDRIVVSEGSSVAPSWIGPSSDETNATDWHAV